MALIAYDHKKPVGYILETPQYMFLDKYNKASVVWKNDEHKKRFHKIIINGKYSYLDQIGVLFGYHRTGVAYELLSAFEKLHKKELVLSLFAR